MHRPLLAAIACAFALSVPALAQQDASTQPPTQNTPEPQGGSFLDRVKNAFKSLGEKAKPAAETAKEKAAPKLEAAKEKASEGLDKAKDVATDVKDDTKDGVKAGRERDTSAMGASGSQPAATSPKQ